MKFLKNHFKLGVLLLGALLILNGCEQDHLSNSSEDEYFNYVELELTKEDIAKVAKLNFNTYELKLISQLNNAGIDEKYFLIEGDILISTTEIDNMISSKNSSSKHYHSNNTVTNIQTITIRGVNQGSNALSNAQQSALTAAIQAYNDLNIKLNFILTFGPNDNTKNINAIQVSGGAGGRADFPSNGNPGSIARIFSGSGTNNTILRHIWIHELGHTLGLRHTDWFSRQSCGSYNPESINSSSVPNANGANHIPGTPTGFDPTSIMLSCYDNTVTGTFNNNDIIALEYLYPLPLPVISGISLTCGTQSQTFTLSNGGISVAWQKSSNLNVLSQNNNGITVIPTNSTVNGSGFVRAITSKGTIQKDFWIGKPNINFSQNEDFTMCRGENTTTNNFFPVTILGEDNSTIWEVQKITNNHNVTMQGNEAIVSLQFAPPYNYIAFKVRASNACGFSNWLEYYVEVTENCGSEGSSSL
ncbi:M57 family metalloprotease [Leeuwenhoekiella marinoflava]|uniref:Dual-action HEIGH metallo-peptidase n=2 Tax=Leeuwenhoekiella marinoflava TaxID=988 RepID=A0A4Q0P6Y1_9FLAO|nr:M57 family metalloprotease [Leeuwenhoekiella marinoflava]RXG22377.1 dual-action HEIGH metallo-peptidase [Leeuwenhoekiella marinoflava]SHF32114.1 Dual-action HEIGH metallo-peptidase [Leeuwenhoekiella marinoflava DSM 3653]